MPVNNGIDGTFVTENNSDLSSSDYESVDLLNRLPFSQSPFVEYIADFDDSVDFGVSDATYNAGEWRKYSFVMSWIINEILQQHQLKVLFVTFCEQDGEFLRAQRVITSKLFNQISWKSLPHSQPWLNNNFANK